MSESTFMDNYYAAIDSEIDKTRRQVLGGKCSDMADYLSKCRKIEAYDRAKDIFKAEVRKYFSEETEDHLNDDKGESSDD